MLQGRCAAEKLSEKITVKGSHHPNPIVEDHEKNPKNVYRMGSHRILLVALILRDHKLRRGPARRSYQIPSTPPRALKTRYPAPAHTTHKKRPHVVCVTGKPIILNVDRTWRYVI